MNRATVFCGLFAQRLEVTPIILVGIETGAAVVAALDDMPRNVGDGDPRSAGHDGPPVSVVLRWLILTETVVRPLFRLTTGSPYCASSHAESPHHSTAFP